MQSPAPSPIRPNGVAARAWLIALVPADWGTWLAVVVLVAVGVWQLPQANSASYKTTPARIETQPVPECPTLEPDSIDNRDATGGTTATESQIDPRIETESAAGATPATPAAALDSDPDDADALQDWRYARGKWVRLSEELGIPPQPANFVQRVSPLLWAALMWLAATWILVRSA